MIKFKIIEVNSDEHSIVVRFYTDLVTEELLATQRNLEGDIVRCRTDYNFNLPIPAPLGEDLVSFLLARAPVEWLRNQEMVMDPTIDTSLSGLVAMIGEEIAVPAA